MGCRKFCIEKKKKLRVVIIIGIGVLRSLEAGGI